MVRELRDLSLHVARCAAAIEMPEAVRHRDELVRRFAATAIKPEREEWDPDAEPEVEAGSLLLAVLEDDDLPLYF
jgi:hypothetical protein